MRPLTLREVRARLASEGLEVPPEEVWADAARRRPQAPWFVAALAGVGGWFAAILLGVGVGAILHLRHGTLGAAGLAICAAAAVARRRAQGVFLQQFLLAASLAGQGMFAVAILDDRRFSVDELGTRTWLLLAAVEAAVAVAFADPVHRFITSAASGAFLRVALWAAGVDDWSPAVFGAALVAFWAAPGRAFRPPVASQLRRPMGYAAAALFAGVLLFPLLRSAFWGGPPSPGAALRAASERNVAAATAAIALGIAGARALARLRVTLGSSAGTAFFLGGAGIAALGTQAPGVPASLAVMAFAVEAREPVLFWAGAAAGTTFLSWWYYDLSATLLVKAGILSGMGLVLLGARLFASRRRAP